MDFVNLLLLAASALVFASVLAGLFSVRIGFSFLLVFLFAGIRRARMVRAVIASMISV